MDVREVYLEIRPEDIAYVKFILESYEGVGIVRTVDQKKAVIVLLILDDFQETARSILTCLDKEVSVTEVPRPPDLGDDWLLRELAAEESPS